MYALTEMEREINKHEISVINDFILFMYNILRHINKGLLQI